jgi:hypothetical protein
MTMLTTRNKILASLALSLALTGTASATPIGPGAFGPLAVVESFEGIATGPNVAIGLGASLLEPGVVSAHAFGTGVSLTSPIPNPGFDLAGPFVHDFALATDVTNNWGANGTVASAANVPMGSAYMGAFAGSGNATITLSFATPQDRVGAYVSGVAGTTVTMRVYDASGTLLESVSGATVPVGSWAGNFLGIERPEQISRVVFSAPDFGIDGLTFENDPVLVPEASTLSSILLGLAGICGLAVIGRDQRAPVAAVARLKRSELKD